jgi:4'-phosphopantetheinyl transferase
VIPSVESISVVWLNLDAPHSEVEELRTVLSVPEGQRVSQYTSDTQRRRAIVRMARRRQILASVYDTDPNDIVFAFSERGKPSVVRDAGPQLSISSSHRGDVGVFAFVRDRAIGVDVETISELPETVQFVDVVTSDFENSCVERLPQYEQAATMLRLWTRKEALLKATGQGIGAGMKHITVPLEKAAHGLAFQPVSEGPSWLLYELECPRPELGGALVVSADVVRPTPLINTSYL